MVNWTAPLSINVRSYFASVRGDSYDLGEIVSLGSRARLWLLRLLLTEHRALGI